MHLDITDLIAADHRAIEELFGALGDDRDDSFIVMHRLIDELSAHITAEQQILLPALRDIVPGGAAMANAGQDEHKEMRTALAQLESSHPGEADFDTALRKLVADMQTHVTAAENSLIPALRAVIGEEKMRELGDIYDQVKQTVPSGLSEPPATGPTFTIT